MRSYYSTRDEVYIDFAVILQVDASHQLRSSVLVKHRYHANPGRVLRTRTSTRIRVITIESKQRVQILVRNASHTSFCLPAEGFRAEMNSSAILDSFSLCQMTPIKQIQPVGQRNPR